ncbi:MAG: cation-translocating P-type ATPase [Methanomassiliicoccus sp.]|nr:cation-translocating P-type ATPase [Methanomassiliicoccus sp.]
MGYQSIIEGSGNYGRSEDENIGKGVSWILGSEGDAVRVVASIIALVASLLLAGSAPLLSDVLMLSAILACGLPIVIGAARGVVTRLDIRADVLVSIALVGAVLIGEPFAAAEISIIMTIGTIFEDRTARKAEEGITRLMELKPATARVVGEDGSESIIPAEEVGVGVIVRVLPGERIPVDGTIIRGRTSVDQSVLTGESLPVDKDEADEVFSGTVNQFGTFDMRATKANEDSSLSKVIEMVRSADVGKAEVVRAADRWATWIVIAALISAVLTYSLTGAAVRAVTVLVVFCPCALVLATPTAMMAGIGNATKFGILVRSGDAMERLAKVDRVFIDKTGTLTNGMLEVISVEACAPMAADDLLALVAGAESRSEHPVGRAIICHARSRRLPLPSMEDLRVVPGRGIVARSEGRTVQVGNAEMMAETGMEVPKDLEASARQHRARGRATVFVSTDSKIIGMLALSDTLRDDARRTIERIHGLGLRTMLLTGDNAGAASCMAGAAGIPEMRAGLLPQDKMALIVAARDEENVCMVGDGINDAAALKGANVGVAMGGMGSDISVSVADVVLMNDDLRRLPYLLELSRKVLRTIHMNILAAMTLNLAAMILAAIGLLDPVVGALVHNVGSVLVVLNSARLLRVADPEGLPPRQGGGGGGISYHGEMHPLAGEAAQ